jgi:serine/threonine protein kinase
MTILESLNTTGLTAAHISLSIFIQRSLSVAASQNRDVIPSDAPAAKATVQTCQFATLCRLALEVLSSCLVIAAEALLASDPDTIGNVQSFWKKPMFMSIKVATQAVLAWNRLVYLDIPCSMHYSRQSFITTRKQLQAAMHLSGDLGVEDLMKMAAAFIFQITSAALYEIPRVVALREKWLTGDGMLEIASTPTGMGVTLQEAFVLPTMFPGPLSTLSLIKFVDITYAQSAKQLRCLIDPRAPVFPASEKEHESMLPTWSLTGCLLMIESAARSCGLGADTFEDATSGKTFEEGRSGSGVTNMQSFLQMESAQETMSNTMKANGLVKMLTRLLSLEARARQTWLQQHDGDEPGGAIGLGGLMNSAPLLQTLLHAQEAQQTPFNPSFQLHMPEVGRVVHSRDHTAASNTLAGPGVPSGLKTPFGPIRPGAGHLRPDGHVPLAVDPKTGMPLDRKEKVINIDSSTHDGGRGAQLLSFYSSYMTDEFSRTMDTTDDQTVRSHRAALSRQASRSRGLDRVDTDGNRSATSRSDGLRESRLDNNSREVVALIPMHRPGSTHPGISFTLPMNKSMSLHASNAFPPKGYSTGNALESQAEVGFVADPILESARTLVRARSMGPVRADTDEIRLPVSPNEGSESFGRKSLSALRLAKSGPVALARSGSAMDVSLGDENAPFVQLGRRSTASGAPSRHTRLESTGSFTGSFVFARHQSSTLAGRGRYQASNEIVGEAITSLAFNSMDSLKRSMSVYPAADAKLVHGHSVVFTGAVSASYSLMHMHGSHSASGTAGAMAFMNSHVPVVPGDPWRPLLPSLSARLGRGFIVEASLSRGLSNASMFPTLDRNARGVPLLSLPKNTKKDMKETLFKSTKSVKSHGPSSQMASPSSKSFFGSFRKRASVAPSDMMSGQGDVAASPAATPASLSLASRSRPLSLGVPTLHAHTRSFQNLEFAFANSSATSPLIIHTSPTEVNSPFPTATAADVSELDLSARPTVVESSRQEPGFNALGALKELAVLHDGAGRAEDPNNAWFVPAPVLPRILPIIGFEQAPINIAVVTPQFGEILISAPPDLGIPPTGWTEIDMLEIGNTAVVALPVIRSRSFSPSFSLPPQIDMSPKMRATPQFSSQSMPKLSLSLPTVGASPPPALSPSGSDPVRASLPSPRQPSLAMGEVAFAFASASDKDSSTFAMSHGNSVAPFSNDDLGQNEAMDGRDFARPHGSPMMVLTRPAQTKKGPTYLQTRTSSLLYVEHELHAIVVVTLMSCIMRPDGVAFRQELVDRLPIAASDNADEDMLPPLHNWTRSHSRLNLFGDSQPSEPAEDGSPLRSRLRKAKSDLSNPAIPVILPDSPIPAPPDIQGVQWSGVDEPETVSRSIVMLGAASGLGLSSVSMGGVPRERRVFQRSPEEDPVVGRRKPLTASVQAAAMIADQLSGSPGAVSVSPTLVAQNGRILVRHLARSMSVGVGPLPEAVRDFEPPVFKRMSSGLSLTGAAGMTAALFAQKEKVRRRAFSRDMSSQAEEQPHIPTTEGVQKSADTAIASPTARIIMSGPHPLLRSATDTSLLGPGRRRLRRQFSALSSVAVREDAREREGDEEEDEEQQKKGDKHALLDKELNEGDLVPGESTPRRVDHTKLGIARRTNEMVLAPASPTVRASSAPSMLHARGDEDPMAALDEHPIYVLQCHLNHPGNAFLVNVHLRQQCERRGVPFTRLLRLISSEFFQPAYYELKSHIASGAYGDVASGLAASESPAAIINDTYKRAAAMVKQEVDDFNRNGGFSGTGMHDPRSGPQTLFVGVDSKIAAKSVLPPQNGQNDNAQTYHSATPAVTQFSADIIDLAVAIKIINFSDDPLERCVLAEIMPEVAIMEDLTALYIKPWANSGSPRTVGGVASRRDMSVKSAAGLHLASANNPTLTALNQVDPSKLAGAGCPIVVLLDYGVTPTACWIVMERCYTSLRAWRMDRLQSKVRKRDAVVYLDLFICVIYRLLQLHSLGVTHYDVKCDNILVRDGFVVAMDLVCPEQVEVDGMPTVSQEDRWTTLLPHVCFTDFGESTFHPGVDASAVPLVGSRGTECIRSPEMLAMDLSRQGSAGRGDTGSIFSGSNSSGQEGAGTRSDDPHAAAFSSTATDVWGIGCLLYELCTGGFLFQDDNWARFYFTVTGENKANGIQSSSASVATSLSGTARRRLMTASPAPPVDVQATRRRMATHTSVGSSNSGLDVRSTDAPLPLLNGDKLEALAESVGDEAATVIKDLLCAILVRQAILRPNLAEVFALAIKARVSLQED